MKQLSVAGSDWFAKAETQAVFASLNREGFEARIVGGAVRNALLGRAVGEIDFATTARPEETIRLAEKAGLKAVPTGFEHGTVTLVVGTTPFEVTTLRRDVSTDGRRATVAFAEDWASDAMRRDFTMNALYADASGSIHDPLGGLDDLRERRVRFVGDAVGRIREDYLRILRFFRFSADYAEGAFDPEGVTASISERLGLRTLSRERIRGELLQILVARRATSAIEIMDDAGLLLLILGGVARRTRFEQLCRIDTPQALVDPIFRLAALGIFIEEDALRIADRLRLSSAEAADLMALAAISPIISRGTGSAELKAHLYRLGARRYLGRVLMAWASSEAAIDDEAFALATSLARDYVRPKFPVTGKDLMDLGWKPGPAMGARLQILEERWIASGFAASRDELLAVSDALGVEG